MVAIVWSGWLAAPTFMPSIWVASGRHSHTYQHDGMLHCNTDSSWSVTVPSYPASRCSFSYMCCMSLLSRLRIQVFDKDQRGFIEAKELRHVLTNIGEKLSVTEMEDMIKEADPDSDGKIQYEEFVRLLLAR